MDKNNDIIKTEGCREPLNILEAYKTGYGYKGAPNYISAIKELIKSCEKELRGERDEFICSLLSMKIEAYKEVIDMIDRIK